MAQYNDLNYFTRFNNWLKKRSLVLFLISNAVYSGSTYLVNIATPYIINDQKEYASYTISIQGIFLFLFLWDLGLSVGYLRFYNLNDIKTRKISSLFELFIYLTILLAYFNPNNVLTHYVINAKELGPNVLSLIYLGVLSQISWIFLRNHFLSKKSYVYILYNALVILLFRFAGLYFVYIYHFDYEHILLFCMILPFTLVFIHKIWITMCNLIQITSLSLKELWQFSKEFISFSSVSYLSALTYIYAIRYLVFFLKGHHQDDILADLGLGLSFLGILSLINVTLRNYFIGNLTINDPEAIKAHLIKVRSKGPKLLITALFLSVIISIVIYFIKPSYISINVSIYTFTLLAFNSTIMYLSLYNILIKTFNYVKIELAINIVRMLLVIILVPYFYQLTFMYTLMLTLFTILVFEIVLKYLLNRRIKELDLI